MGSSTSRARVCTAIAEKSVPTAATPTVAASATAMNQALKSERSYSTRKAGNMSASTVTSRVTTLSSLPR